MIFSSLNLPPRFYIYMYLREDMSPYYVGKGKDNRAWVKHSNETKPPKDRSRVIVTHADLNEISAFMLERWLIRWYGRKDLGTGILRNKTDGGEGASGCIKLRGVPKSDAHRKNLSIARSGKKYPKLSASKKGTTQTKESNILRSIALKGKVKPQRRVCCINCKKNIYWAKLDGHVCASTNTNKLNKQLKEKKTQNVTAIKESPSGKKHYRYDSKILTFTHLDGTIEKMPANDFSIKYSLNRGWLSNVLLGNRKTIKGWIVTR